MLRPGQTSVALLKALLQTFLKPDNLLLDRFDRTHFTVHACLLLGGYKELLRYEKDSNCVEKLMKWAVEVYGYQLLTDKYDLNGKEELKEAL